MLLASRINLSSFRIPTFSSQSREVSTRICTSADLPPADPRPLSNAINKILDSDSFVYRFIILVKCDELANLISNVIVIYQLIVAVIVGSVSSGYLLDHLVHLLLNPYLLYHVESLFLKILIHV